MKIAIAVVACFFIVAIWGIFTDCPNTAGYVFCEPSEIGIGILLDAIQSMLILGGILWLGDFRGD